MKINDLHTFKIYLDTLIYVLSGCANTSLIRSMKLQPYLKWCLRVQNKQSISIFPVCIQSKCTATRDNRQWIITRLCLEDQYLFKYCNNSLVGWLGSTLLFNLPKTTTYSIHQEYLLRNVLLDTSKFEQQYWGEKNVMSITSWLQIC